MLRDILPQGGSRNDRSVQKNLMETLMEGKMILRGDTMKDEGMQDYIAKIAGEKSFIFFRSASGKHSSYYQNGREEQIVGSGWIGWTVSCCQKIRPVSLQWIELRAWR